MDISIEELTAALREVLEEEFGMGACELADRFKGGKLVLQPFDAAVHPVHAARSDAGHATDAAGTG